MDRLTTGTAFIRMLMSNALLKMPQIIQMPVLMLKGSSSIFEFGFYEVLIHSQSVTFCTPRSAVSLLGDWGRNHCTGSQHCTVADGVSRKTFFAA